MPRFLVSALVLIATVVVSTPKGHALEPNASINVQVFRPSPHTHDFFSTMGSHVPQHLRWSASAMFNFGLNPLVFVDTSTSPDRRHEVVKEMLTLDLMGSLALVEWLDIGLAIPVFLYMNGDGSGFASPTEALPVGALGDIRISPKLRIIRRDTDSRGHEKDGFGLAATFELGIPSGTTSFVSDGFTFVPTVIADYRISGFQIALNLGARIRAPGEEKFSFLTVDHELLWRVGASYEVLDRELEVVAELYGATSNFSGNSTYLEGLIGGRYTLADLGVSVTLGGGSGFLQGYGNTKFRLFAGVAYAEPIERDADGDGFLDDLDKCPNSPEDKDGFEDKDGCPEPDNDRDGIADLKDKCPMDPEDKDGWEDDDGCPEADNDGDGIEDAADKCPKKAEDRDKFEDKDGCPDLDNDKDGIPDASDTCPNKPETRNGFEDEDGCPDKTKAKIEGKRIVITDKVFFDNGKATIKEESHALLRDVANILKANLKIRISIEGHTDDRGSNKRNLKLSQERAASVLAFLVAEGVAKERLTATGFGEERPAMEGKTPEAREKNRRVEFKIKD